MSAIKLVRIASLSLLLALALVLSVPFAGNQATSDAHSVSLGYFYSSLSPYGRWVTVERYGKVWYPSRVPVGWQPYTVGRWVHTEYGWMWVSLDPWGDIPYHYGAWTFVAPYGWVWVPGYVWAPAWVTWSYSDAYIGWAPIPPTLVITSVGYVGPPVVMHETHYVFVPVHRFVNINVTTVRVRIQQNVTIIREARHVTNFKVVGGTVRNTAIPVTHIERVTRTRIQNTDISAVKSKPTRIEAGGSPKGDKLPVAGPPERKMARIEEKSNQHEKTTQQPNEIAPHPRKDRGPSAPPTAGPAETKGGRIEEKGNHQGERQAQPPHKISPRARTGRGSSEPPIVSPFERKAERIEEKSNHRGERQTRPPHKGSPEPRIKEQHGQKQKEKGETPSSIH